MISADSPNFYSPPRVSEIFTKNDDRPIRHYIRYTAGFDIKYLKFPEINIDCGQYRGLNQLSKPGGFFRRFIGPGNYKALSHSDPGHSFYKMAIDAGTDAEGKHIGIPEAVAHQVKHLFFNRHIAVGGNDNGTRISFDFRQRQGPIQGR